MIDARLATLSTAKASGRDASQGPSVVEEDNERTTRVTDTGILSAILIAGAKHFRKDLQVNAPRMVPGFTLVILDDGNVNLLQQSGSIAIGERGIRLPPASHDAVPAFEGDASRRQADGKDVVRVPGCLVQLEDSDVKAIRMGGREAEVWMESDFSDGEELRRVLLESMILNVICTNDDGQLLERRSVHVCVKECEKENGETV